MAPPIEDVSGSFPGWFSGVKIDALDFERAEVVLNELAGYVEHMAPIMEVAKEIARNDMADRFQSQIDPEGNKWIDLDPDYAKRKEHDVGFVYPILTRTRALREAATSEEAWSVSGESIFFSTVGLPDYWRVHQEGSLDWGTHFHGGLGAKTNQAGEHIPAHESQSDPKLTTSKGSRDQNLPPRPFIGLSQDAVDEIFIAFDQWWATGIEEATRKYKGGSHGGAEIIL